LTKSDDAARGAAHFKVVHQPDGRFHWKLINPHGTPVVRSMETFVTEDEPAVVASVHAGGRALATEARPGLRSPASETAGVASYETRSMTAAMAWPKPMHIVASP
jgi:hypothetical protein